MARTQHSANIENGILGISTSRGFRKVIICHAFDGEKIDHFQWKKKLLVPSVPDFRITDSWSCQLSPFPIPPTPTFAPPPPVTTHHPRRKGGTLGRGCFGLYVGCVNGVSTQYHMDGSMEGGGSASSVFMPLLFSFETPKNNTTQQTASHHNTTQCTATQHSTPQCNTAPRPPSRRACPGIHTPADHQPRPRWTLLLKWSQWVIHNGDGRI